MKSFICSYCGALAETRDHTVPIAVRFSGSRRLGRHSKISGGIVSCQECNNLLNTVILETIEERAAFLARRLKRKYCRRFFLSSRRKRFLSPQEENDLEPNLREQVQALKDEREKILARIAHCERVAGGQK